MYNKVYLECSDCPIKKNTYFFLPGDVSISSARIKQSDGRGLFEIFEGVKDLGSSLGNLVGSESNETIGFDIAEVVADSVSLIGTSVGSESTENIGIVGKLVGKLIENTAFSAQSYNSSFKLRRIPIYRLIYTVQNEQIMLAEPGVEPIQMKQSEFLDAKHIRLVFFVCHKTSDVISDVDSKLISFLLFLRGKAIYVSNFY